MPGGIFSSSPTSSVWHPKSSRRVEVRRLQALSRYRFKSVAPNMTSSFLVPICVNTSQQSSWHNCVYCPLTNKSYIVLPGDKFDCSTLDAMRIAFNTVAISSVGTTDVSGLDK